MVIGLVRQKPRIVMVGFIGLLFFSNRLVPELLLRAWETDPVERLATNYQIAVVLTGFTNSSIKVGDQIQFSEGVDRITEAIRLYKSGQVEKILISGGSGSILYPELTESTSIARFAKAAGVDEDDLLLEANSRNTYENARYTRELLDKSDLSKSSLLLITSAFHMRRAEGCFHKAGLFPTTYPVDYQSGGPINLFFIIPSARAISVWDLLISELVGCLTYRLMGYL